MILQLEPDLLVKIIYIFKKNKIITVKIFENQTIVLRARSMPYIDFIVFILYIEVR